MRRVFAWIGLAGLLVLGLWLWRGGGLLTGPTAMTGLSQSFADIYARVAPAVVSIESRRTITPPRLRMPLWPFFGVPEYLPPRQARGSGSGFFISADGYILTNDHVVAGADRVMVVLQDGRRLPARLAGRDRRSDLALLKVEGGTYPFVSFATRARPRVGDWVIAIGNPFGLGSTATAGIVSAYDRQIGEDGLEVMQLDAAINPGSSGGPAFDVRGQVVGVNTAILSPDGGFIGIGFALPAERAEAVARRLMAAERSLFAGWRSREQTR
jgi:serine protease Do